MRHDWFRTEMLGTPCPHCGRGRLRRTKVDGRPVAYRCEQPYRDAGNCGLRFHVSELRPFDDGSVGVFGKAEDPEHLAPLQTASLARNLRASVELKRSGVTVLLLQQMHRLDTLFELPAVAHSRRVQGAGSRFAPGSSLSRPRPWSSAAGR